MRGHCTRDQALQTPLLSSITSGTKSPSPWNDWLSLFLQLAETWDTHIELLSEPLAVVRRSRPDLLLQVLHGDGEVLLGT